MTDLADLERATPASFSDRVGPLFEGAPSFLGRLAGSRPFGSWEGLFLVARRVAHGMPEPEQVELVNAHPRLGAQPESVSALSQAEQGYGRPAGRPKGGDGTGDRAPAAIEDGSETAVDGKGGRAAELGRLNDAYEARYGFRYCTFVAGRPRTALVAELAATLAAQPSRPSELARAIDAVIDIAQDRQRKLAGQAAGSGGA